MHRFIVSCSMVACAVVAQGQTPAEPARIVRLNVVAADNSGQPATGLTVGDFQLTDQGKAQHIAIFRDESHPVAAAAAERSNHPAPGTHATVVLLDFLEESRSERVDSVRKLGPELKRIESGECISLYLLAPDGALVPLHAMPKGPGTPGEKGWTADAETLLAAGLKNQNKDRPAGMSSEDMVKKTYVALETLANQLSSFPGRKDIVWITSRVPYVLNPQIQCKADWWDCALYVPHLTVTLEHAGVLVDPFSYSGLGVSEARTLDEFAALTGGRFYPNQELPAVVKQFAEPSGSYSIAFAPPAEAWDSKFHHVKLTCERKGVKLQARQYYYALPDQRPIAARQQQLMVAAYQSTSDVADIGLRAAITRAKANTVKVDLRVDPTGVALRAASGQYDGRVTLVFSTRAASGPQGEPAVADIDLHLTREQMDAAAKEGIPISREFPIDPATERVRLIVADRSTDAVGSLTVPMK